MKQIEITELEPLRITWRDRIPDCDFQGRTGSYGRGRNTGLTSRSISHWVSFLPTTPRVYLQAPSSDEKVVVYQEAGA